jgi:hypothetical protein
MRHETGNERRMPTQTIWQLYALNVKGKLMTIGLTSGTIIIADYYEVIKEGSDGKT